MSTMTLLWLIWSVSLVLALLALLILAWLVWRRFRHERQRAVAAAGVAAFGRRLQDAVEQRRWIRLLEGEDGDTLALAVPELLRRYHGPRRMRAVRVLEHASVVPALMRLALDDDDDTAVAALFACARLSRIFRIPILREGLRHPDREVRLVAAEFLVTCAGERSLAEIFNAILPDPEARPDYEAARILRHIGSRGLPYCRSLLQRTGARRSHRVAALLVLAECRDAAALPLLREALDSTDPAERSAAWRGLALWGDGAIKGRVATGLRDHEWFVRSQVVFYIGRLGLTELAAALEPLLDAEVWWERYRAADAMASLGQRGRRRLREISREQSRRSRVALAVLAEQRGLRA